MAHTSLKGHCKLNHLCRTLKLSNMTATGMLVHLWWDAYQRPKVCRAGVLHGRTAHDIAMCVEWEGDPEELVKALCASGLLDRINDEFAIHDLVDHCPSYVKERWDRQDRKLEKDGKPPHVCEHMRQYADVHGRTPGACSRNLTKPDLTDPNQTQSDKTHAPPMAGASEESAPRIETTRSPRSRTEATHDLLSDVVAELWFDSATQTKSDQRHICRIVKNLIEREATPDDVRNRRARALELWSKPSMVTPQAVLKNWHVLGGENSDGCEEPTELELARRDDRERLERRRVRSE